MAETKRLPQLEGLRGIAILTVFIYHVVNVPYFWSGVDLFFVLQRLPDSPASAAPEAEA